MTDNEKVTPVTLPCDVLLPPFTVVRKGTQFDTLLVALKAREACPADASVLADPSRASRLLAASDVFRDGLPVTVTSRDYSYTGRLAGIAWKASGALRYIVEDEHGRLFIHNSEQIGKDEGWVP
jgi:hypothetical protein